ncbi:MAG: glutamate ligase domain-containing protein [Microbacteriaceae bacterium]
MNRSAAHRLADATAAVGIGASVQPESMVALEPAPGILVINDAAEATPLTMVNSLKVLAELGIDGSRTVAVLGELDDVGDEWREQHDRIGRIVVRLNISSLIVVGDGARHIHNAAGLEGSWNGESMLVDTLDEAYAVLGKDLRAGDVVLVKASARAGLGSLADRLGGVTA